MRVILLKEIKNVGKKDEIKEVNDGYARNFLFPKGLAVQYTKGSAEVLDKQIEDRKEHERISIDNAKESAKKLENITLNFKLKVGEGSKTFGSITSKHIKEKLEELKIDVDRKKIILKNNIDTLGSHKVRIELYKGVFGTITVSVEAE